MPGSHAGRLALLAALAVATAAPVSLAAAEVYVPVIVPVANDGSRSETELWIANPGTAAANATTFYLDADTNGTQRTGIGTVVTVSAGRSVNVTGLAQNGKSGLVAVDVGSSSLLVEGRIITTAANGGVVISRLPVISDATKLAAGAKALLLGLERDPERGRLIHFGVVNAGTQAAQCQVSFFRADGAQVGTTVTLDVKPVSLRHFADALGLIGAGRVAGVRGEVSCNQPFFAYGASFHWPSPHYMFVTPANAAPASNPGGPANPPPTGNSIVFERLGLIHEATVGNPKGIVAVTVPRELSLKRLVLDMEFVPGPWNREKIPGNHGIVWLHRGKFRSNTVANVNAFGPNKFTVKANQNVDLAAGSVTSSEGSLTFVEGQRYHIHYVYDAENQLVTTTVSSGGQTLRTISMAGSASARRLTVPSAGMVAEFGHYFGQDEGPEVASPKWKYYDLRVEMVPY